jgi:hypothetical protein
MRRHIKTDLGFKAFRPTLVNELSIDDLQERQDACARFLEVFTTIPKRGGVTFTDEYAIYRSSRNRNVYLWSKKKNPHFHVELEHNPPHVMIWAGISARHIFGPYFFEGSVNQHTYLTLLRNWSVPQLERMNLIGKVWFQQDG